MISKSVSVLALRNTQLGTCSGALVWVVLKVNCNAFGLPLVACYIFYVGSTRLIMIVFRGGIHSTEIRHWERIMLQFSR